MGTEKTEKIVDHPLEEIFGIEEGTTSVPSVVRSSDIIETPLYDRKDKEIDGQFQEIYDTALEAFEEQAEEAELVEGKYRARNHEIAAQYLTIALNAANSKGTHKVNRDKHKINELKLMQSKRGDTPPGGLSGSRNDVLKALQDMDEMRKRDEAIDMED